MQQVLLETGHLSTHYLLRRNNLFAFRYTEEYIRFDHWKESVEYYKRWQEKHYTNHQENYYAFLKRVKYAGSRNYVEVLRRVSIRKG